MTQFTFDVNTEVFRNFNDFADECDVFLKRQNGTVRHDRIESFMDGKADLIEITAVIQMESYGDAYLVSVILRRFSEQFIRQNVIEARVMHKDNRFSGFFCTVADTFDHVDVCAVKCQDTCIVFLAHGKKVSDFRIHFFTPIRLFRISGS